MKTVLKIISVIVVGIVVFYYIKSENYKKEMEENSVRIQNEIDRQNKIISLDSADNERRKAIELAELRVRILQSKK
jgi:hypothetical protein